MGRLHRRCLALTLTLGLALVASPLRAAHAEILDYDPETEPVPELLPEADRAQLASFQGARWAGLAAALSPDGRYGLANGPDGLMLRDLETDLTRNLPTDAEGLRQEGGYSSELAGTGWEAPHWLILLTAETQGEGDTAVTTFRRLKLDAAGGPVSGTVIPDFGERMGSAVSLSPDLSRILVQRRKGGGTLSAAKQVTLGHPDWSPRRPGLPQSIPGEVGKSPLGSIPLQQEASELAVVDLIGPPAGRATPGWPVSAGARTAAAWR